MAFLYSKLSGRNMDTRIAAPLAEQLITDVDVETYEDMRPITLRTLRIYMDRCGVKVIDAELLLEQFWNA